MFSSLTRAFALTALLLAVTFASASPIADANLVMREPAEGPGPCHSPVCEP